MFFPSLYFKKINNTELKMSTTPDLRIYENARLILASGPASQHKHGRVTSGADNVNKYTRDFFG
jgi:hypothetical protein